MLSIPTTILTALADHARSGFPLEICGILGGADGLVSEHDRLTNTDQSREHFTMDPKEQFAVVKALRAKGKRMLAIYHSHPDTPARLSEEDLRLALTPGVSYIIVSLATGEPVIKSFLVENGAAVEEEIKPV
ncbi:MAG: M67 family metallopeptidase [Verrucomicrobiota bacterium]|jgi:proteasome lid subunit RPN8/RPN11|nr:M67 family metallopeptidase [Verrucomicrobiota bacterium]